MTQQGETPIRAAILGSGIIGRHHADAMARLPRLRVDAVIDAVPEAAAALAARLPSQPGSYASLAEALADRQLDLVTICTPSGMHADAAQEALAAGKHVVIEKPLDVSFDRARQVAELATQAQKRGQVCSVISQHRFDPASVAVYQAVAQGSLGRITSAVASVAWWREQSYYDSAGWRGTRALDGGVTMNQAIHTIDLLVWLLGEPVEVFAYTDLLAHERVEIEDVAVACVRFRSGALAVLHATTAAYPGLPTRLQIHGSRGSAIIHDDQLEYLHVAGAQGEANQAPPAEKEADGFLMGHVRQYQDIINAIDEGRAAAIGAQESLTSLAVVIGIYRSAERGRPVRMEEL
jgi:UDP-N-acetyl-2-amino-2-deoxyglucuronate dehydrogenase